MLHQFCVFPEIFDSNPIYAKYIEMVNIKQRLHLNSCKLIHKMNLQLPNYIKNERNSNIFKRNCVYHIKFFKCELNNNLEM